MNVIKRQISILNHVVQKLYQEVFIKGVRKDFDTFAIAQGSLPDTNWFLKVVDQWYISYFGDGPESPEYREDALRCYYEVEKRNNGFFRKQKSAQL